MYDVVDLGCGSGGSMVWAISKFGGTRHIGFTKSQTDVALAKNQGLLVQLADIIEDDFIVPKTKCVTLLHVLEHLSSQIEVEKVLRKALASASDFIYVRGPYFDGYEYLRTLGFKLTWTDWIGHPTAVTKRMLSEILNNCNVNDSNYEIGFLTEITNSLSEEIIPFNSPIDTILYDSSLGKKEYINFSSVYREIYCIINCGLSSLADIKNVLNLS